ncbi:DMT family transporter [Sphingobacterium yanglingense]|uniref:Putative multidrug resistance efflux transporter n=1 Tax=Sphingobacterium yanglingense TaxID=1437280 RepID=A0A4R6WKI0_9SPHI|nr:multidrug resistance efflux transporter family protein [Sphingobacterium yanglingense]TDQ76301.1 putative multidrug resistance efflux transporter [Sphingobacterium yanglingense]
MKNTQRAFLLGLLSALFFAVTFVVNRLMSVEGGSWIWSASLRFYWMLPFFLIIVILRNNLTPLLSAIKQKPLPWLLWSTIGFGVFYAPLTYAAAFSPSWLVASTWQITIIAGMILAPFINKNHQSSNSKSTYTFSAIILLGIAIMQIQALGSVDLSNLLSGFLWVLVAAFAYPLGNRKMMQLTGGTLDVYQRILGMILCSIPFWIGLNLYSYSSGHPSPSDNQLLQTLIVAVFSGVIATVLFFTATDMVRKDEKGLAKVEATQSAEVVFAVIGEIVILQSPLPDSCALIGMLLVIIGMSLHSLKK